MSSQSLDFAEALSNNSAENNGLQNIQKSNYFDSRPHILRGIFAMVIAICALAIFLFMPLFSVKDSSEIVTCNITLLDLISTLFTKGVHSFYVAEFGISLSVTIPGMVTWLMIFSAAGWIAVFVAGLLSALGVIKNIDKWVLFGIAAAFAVFQLIVFVLIIVSSDFYGINLDEQKVVFFKSFGLGASYLVSIFLAVFSAGVSLGISKKNIRFIRKYKSMYLLLLVPILTILIYSLYPMILSVIISLKNYKISDGIWGSDWVGFDNFVAIFTDSGMLTIIGNTMLISCSRMLIGIIPPLTLAIMLFDMGFARLRKGIQTIIYIPHFFSWVVVYGVAYAFINPDGLFKAIFGFSDILANEQAFIPLLLITDLWKECGWGTILYMAALTNVDPTLYEAAAIDGAGPIRRLFNVSLPCIMPTLVFTSVMAVGNLLKGAGYEQIMLFGSENMSNAQVIDTWVVWKGLNGLQYGIGSAVSFFQALIGMIMVVGCNTLSKKWVGVGLY